MADEWQIAVTDELFKLLSDNDIIDLFKARRRTAAARAPRCQPDSDTLTRVTTQHETMHLISVTTLTVLTPRCC